MHTTILTIPAMIASFMLVSFLVFYAIYLVYVYLNIISFVAIISLNDNLIKTMKITRTSDSYGYLLMPGKIEPLSAVCNTAGYYSSKLFKNVYNIWYVRIYHSDDDTVAQNTDIDVTITYK